MASRVLRVARQAQLSGVRIDRQPTLSGGACEMTEPMTDDDAAPAARRPSLLDAVIPIVALAVTIAGSLALFGLDALDGPIQVALILCCAVAALVALKNGYTWGHVTEAGQGALSSITSALFILLAVGALIGTWNMSGTFPRWCTTGFRSWRPVTSTSRLRWYAA